ncbi:UNVERIFIED_CONTAM: hypothetical protein RMT77_002437 [Armadillidium vulgare]
MNDSTPKISLSFTKTIEKRKLQTSALGLEKTERKEATKETITCFDKDTKISEPPKPEDGLIIPLVESRRETLYKNVKKDSMSNITTKSEKNGDEMSIDEKAAAAVIEESARKLELRNNASLEQQTISVMNCLSDMDGEAPSLENYDEVNVEYFGAAMLRGMGWNKGKGIGKNKRVVEIIDPTNRGDLSQSNKKKKTEKSDPQGEELELKKGSYILIEDGRNRGSYGIVECVDEDHVLIRLAREEKVVRDVEQNIRVVSTKEYKEFSRVINKAMYDDYKSAESKKNNEVKKEKYSDDASKDLRKKDRENDYRIKEKSSKIPEGSKVTRRDIEKPEGSLKDSDKLKMLKEKVRSSKDDKERVTDKLDRNDPNFERKMEKFNYKNDIKEYKDKKKKSNIDKVASKPQPKLEIPWARENLRVRIIDRVYKSGRYHKEKVVIRSIDTVENCTCITDEGKVLYDVNPNHLETVIPKTSAVVLVVKGIYNGQKARILELHKEKEKATIQLLDESSDILRLYYDDICEYVSR